ncbi:endonuclease/exonuclease/phosphatase family protein [Acrocarpospora catenulata]|uniref:endonuclease/exonuclease/phosphatase family protein n=1 Tax=Acrocarpospora catenulata TaxID=2836182 RepID=UPI001BD9AA10|nr:endonuclease/exonuclease/phosphatase family protein [Acrocarpospora catenulata]
MIRVASYNVRGLRDDRAALARVIAALRADVLCLQEVPLRRGPLEAVTGMRLVIGRKVAVLVADGVTVLYAGWHRLRWFPGLERRAVAVAVVEAAGLRLAVGSVHLDLHQGARVAHAPEVLARVEAAAARFGALPVLAGDVNEQPGQPCWRYLAGRLTDAYAVAPRGDGCTFPSRRPDKRIDAIFVGPGLAVRACGTTDPAPTPDDLRRATDHLPVVAEIDQLRE